jgi:thiamine monophosphate kinase
LNEFEIIEYYFKPKLLNNQYVPTLGIGDDAAVISIDERLRPKYPLKLLILRLLQYL